MLLTSEKDELTSSTNSDLLKSRLKFDTLTRNTYKVIQSEQSFTGRLASN